MIEGIKTPGMGTNCYLVSCPETKKALLVDPGAGAEGILEWISQKNVEVIGILLTHGHYDHIGALEEVRDALKVKVYIHRDDAPMLADPQKNLSAYGGRNIRVEKGADVLLQENDVLEIGQLTYTVLHTPGHTPGCICLLGPDGLLSGDTLFCRSIGRTDFPGGSMLNILNSINGKLMLLRDETKVFPGHESTTTIGEERRYNPYLNGDYEDDE
ncbi:beta-lactamase domain protein [Syntrophobotulus glycolicus DSM 8271]|uniref:Beta-lactamase domain protein n=1 Tax=Syntrophobotulus glycolicus (strain DSM 8271 / FlGlyR) TaxID=645991 RepID=F0T252_SYNGF|nr:MBL fold metallo-hydrolase [Syntrophobotulus glycolicus]ADY56396.1 beta-lactamase domain protein [Syntrophobotulus glycolicus DSM 8271]